VAYWSSHLAGAQSELIVAWLARFFLCSFSDRQRVETYPSLEFERFQCTAPKDDAKRPAFSCRAEQRAFRPAASVGTCLWQMGGATSLKIGSNFSLSKSIPSQSSSGESKSCKPLFKRLWLEWDSNEIHPLVPCVIVWKLNRANFFETS